MERPGFTLFLRVHSCTQLETSHTHGSYCKMYLGESAMVNGQSNDIFSNFLHLNDDQEQTPKPPQQTHRIFRTLTQMNNPVHPVWNEKFEVAVRNPHTEILTIRVKSQHTFYSYAIGACSMPLRQLRLGEALDQWFSLHKGSKPRAMGRIRLQLKLSSVSNQDDYKVARPLSMPKKCPEPHLPQYPLKPHKDHHYCERHVSNQLDHEAPEQDSPMAIIGRMASQMEIDGGADSMHAQRPNRSQSTASTISSSSAFRAALEQEESMLSTTGSAFQHVVHDALPSDDDDSDEETNQRVASAFARAMQEQELYAKEIHHAASAPAVMKPPPPRESSYRQVGLDYVDPKPSASAPTLGDLFHASSAIYSLATAESGEEVVESLPEAIHNLAPIGKFVQGMFQKHSFQQQQKQQSQPPKPKPETYFF